MARAKPWKLFINGPGHGYNGHLLHINHKTPAPSLLIAGPISQ